jgi:hypothetical protein
MVIVASNFFQATQHTISFMVDAYVTPAISANEVDAYTFTVKVDGIALQTPIHHNTNPATYTTEYYAAAAPLTLFNLMYYFGNAGVKSRISFGMALPYDMIVYNSQTISIDLGGVGVATGANVIECYVLLADNVTMSTDFLSCDMTSLTAVILKPKTQVSGTFVVVFESVYIHSGSTNPIIAQIIAVDGTTTIITSNSLALPTAAAAAVIATPANVALTRKYSSPGNVAEWNLVFKPTVQPLKNTSSIYLYFPLYYPGDLGYQTFYCTANGIPAGCFLSARRMIRVTNFPQVTAVGGSVSILIWGIASIVVPTPLGKILVAADSDENTFTLDEYLEVTDIASNAAIPTAIAILSYSASNPNVKEVSDITFTFKVGGTPIMYGNLLTVDFPESYGPVLYPLKGPTMYLSFLGSSVLTPIISTYVGSRFKFLLPVTLQPQTTYQFTLKNVQNPDVLNCAEDRPMITISDSAETSVFRSAPNTFNSPRTNYIQNTNLKALSFTDKNGNPVTSIVLPTGLYSPIIKISAPVGETFLNDLTFSIS